MGESDAVPAERRLIVLIQPPQPENAPYLFYSSSCYNTSLSCQVIFSLAKVLSFSLLTYVIRSIPRAFWYFTLSCPPSAQSVSWWLRVLHERELSILQISYGLVCHLLYIYKWYWARSDMFPALGRPGPMIWVIPCRLSLMPLASFFV